MHQKSYMIGYILSSRTEAFQEKPKKRKIPET